MRKTHEVGAQEISESAQVNVGPQLCHALPSLQPL